MRLDQRLRLLRGEVNPQPPALAKGDLAERLRRLGVNVQRRAQNRSPDEQALADAIEADRLAPGVLRVQRRFSLDCFHGSVGLGGCLSALPDLIDEPAGDPSGWLFLDTETSGLAGGTGTWAFLYGLLRFDTQGLVLRQYLLTRLDAELAYLEAIASELRPTQLLVTYNGKSFDGPLLATRSRLAGISMGLEDKRHLDLLHLVRCAFARMWPNCRLVTAEQRLLGFARQGDLAGAEVPMVWLAWLRQGEMEGLAAVLQHNRWDLLALPALAQPLQRSLVDPVVSGADVHGVVRFHLSRGNTALALQLLLANRDRLAPPALLDLARLHSRSGAWAAANAIWEVLASQGLAEAIEAKAKYLEHRGRDYTQALEWVMRLPASPDREHRRRRLEGKLRTGVSSGKGKGTPPHGVSGATG